uniref:hypothetical protein n=1 Tax=Streptomyces sp. WZ-12 TaxID=3030210 RepID=UPI002380DAA1|nr:hypothetical protein [Streptomyces sp. WZ-12]
MILSFGQSPALLLVVAALLGLLQRGRQLVQGRADEVAVAVDVLVGPDHALEQVRVGVPVGGVAPGLAEVGVDLVERRQAVVDDVLLIGR